MRRHFLFPFHIISLRPFPSSCEFHHSAPKNTPAFLEVFLLRPLIKIASDVTGSVSLKVWTSRYEVQKFTPVLPMKTQHFLHFLPLFCSLVRLHSEPQQQVT